MCEDDRSDEFDVCLDDAADAADTLEPIGEYRDLDHYFRSALEEFIDPGARWLLDCLDMDKVRRHFDGDHYRHVIVAGRVYRRRVSS